MKKRIGAKMLGGSPEALGRQADDFYPTPVEVTAALAGAYADKLRGAHIWECAAGAGDMADILAPLAGRLDRTDLAPRKDSIAALDFLTCRRKEWSPDMLSAIVTNPPFNLAESFITAALEQHKPRFMALVLKATFWHAASRWALFEKHPPSAIHPLLWRPDFMLLGAPTMEVMWCVWDWSAEPPCRYIPLPKPSMVRGFFS